MEDATRGRPLDLSDLAADVDPSTPAIWTPEGTVTYGELVTLVRQQQSRLPDRRSLILLAVDNSLGSVVSYLACIASNLPTILLPQGDDNFLSEVALQYDPNLIVDGPSRRVTHRSATEHKLHPELQVLLSTSGSTGSPKLVRLSEKNLTANATSIAQALNLSKEDRCIASLPMSYSYGLSVINSTIAAGGCILLIPGTATQSNFWNHARASNATTLSTTPYMWDLIESQGLNVLQVPSLSRITVAGGALLPSKVSEYAHLGRVTGWDLYVMYGQTEATARIAILPPDLAFDCPDAVGFPIEGGSVRLEHIAGHPLSTGELIYRGPNVMMGYATSAEDLSRGHDLRELATGDLATIDKSGCVRIVGRTSHFTKVRGHRIDLRHLEDTTKQSGVEVACIASAKHINVVTTSITPEAVLSTVCTNSGLPPDAFKLFLVEALPRSQNGKVSMKQIQQIVETESCSVLTGDNPDSSIDAVFQRHLLLSHVDPDRSFADYRGDSLNYISVSNALQRLIPNLPGHWPSMTVRELKALQDRQGPARRVRWMEMLETSILVRAVAIVLIVLNHTDFVKIPGTAHALLLLAGYAFARFVLPSNLSEPYVRRTTRYIATLYTPVLMWLICLVVISDQYGPSLFFVNSLSDEFNGPHLRYWFVEVLLYALVAFGLLFAWPQFRDLLRFKPLQVTGLLAVACFALSLLVTSPDSLHRAYSPVGTLWLFAAGLTLYYLDSKKIAYSILLSGALLIYFDELLRALVCTALVLLVVWVDHIRVPTFLARIFSILASASLIIYLTHWQIYPPIKRGIDFADGALVSALVSLLIGCVAWFLFNQMSLRLFRVLASKQKSPGTPHRQKEAVSADV